MKIEAFDDLGTGFRMLANSSTVINYDYLEKSPSRYIPSSELLGLYRLWEYDANWGVNNPYDIDYVRFIDWSSGTDIDLQDAVIFFGKARRRKWEILC